MKVGGLVALVAVVAVGSSAVFFSCGDGDHKPGESGETATSEGKDVTLPFTLSITGASVDFPAGSVAEGSVVELSGTADQAFAAEGVTAASIGATVSGTKADGSSITEVVTGTLAVTLDINESAALADVEKTTANICVMVTGADGTQRKWLNETLTIAGTTVKFASKWFGTFQALYCGDNFKDVAVVNQAGTDVVVVDTDPVTFDPPCNDVVNGGTKINAIDDKTVATPTGTGGTIADGTYVMTEVRLYTGAPLTGGESTFFKETMVIADGVAQTVGDSFSSDDTVRESFTIAPSGVDPVIKRVCTTANAAEPGISYASYTATATTVTFISTEFSMGVTYTLQH